MKDITPTYWGFIIAYLLPGIGGLYGLHFWSDTLKKILEVFINGQPTVGLSFMVLLAALTVGLIISAFRSVIFEEWICKTDKFSPGDFINLGNEEIKLTSFSAVVDQHYRYHQFWGGMSIVIPMIFLGWIIEFWKNNYVSKTIFGIIGFLILEPLLVDSAIVSFKNYIHRAKQIMKGE